jgi:hypothetical protein
MEEMELVSSPYGVGWPPLWGPLVSQATMFLSSTPKSNINPWINFCFLSMAHIHFTWIEWPTCKVNQPQDGATSSHTQQGMSQGALHKREWPTSQRRRSTTHMHPPAFHRTPLRMKTCIETHLWCILALQSMEVWSYDVEDMSRGSMGPLGVV